MNLILAGLRGGLSSTWSLWFQERAVCALDSAIATTCASRIPTAFQLVCPQQNSRNLGCFLFDTGDDINTFYNQVSNNNNRDLVAGAGGKKLLGNCVIDGAVEGKACIVRMHFMYA